MPPDFLPAGLVTAGLALLLDALDCARDTGSPLWDFAVEIDFLRDAGATLTALRWLVAKNLANHAFEISLGGETKRSFRKLKTFHFGKQSCLMLTDAGAAFARTVCPDSSLQAVPQVSMSQSEGGSPAKPAAKPRWNAASRRLLVGDELVKQFRSRVGNQERLLLAFEEDGWSPCVDDPLPALPKGKAQARLHDTVKGLNHRQLVRRIHFFRDGSGERICWELIASGAPRGTR